MRTVSGTLLLLLIPYLIACAAPTAVSPPISPDGSTSGREVAPSPSWTSPAGTALPIPTATVLKPTDTPPPDPTATTALADTPTSAPTQTASPPPTGTPTQPVDASDDDRSQEQLIARGIEVYRENFCGTCHTLDAADTHGIFGPPHNGVGATAGQRIQDAEYTGAATTAEGYIRESLLDPNIYHVPGYSGGRFTMPTYSNLDAADLDALVYMLLQQR